MPNELPELNSLLQSGNLSYGKWGREFEKRLSTYISTDYLITTNSFNSAVLVLLTTLGLRPGDEVIASPMACLASNQPFATLGISLVWADVDPNIGTLDPDSVRSKITSKTRAIFHNYFCGYIGYVEEINSIAREFGLWVIDDAIEAFGSGLNGRKVGSFRTDATVYSFQTVRLPNSIDGGGISFKDKALYEKAILVRDYGIDRSSFRDEISEINPLCDISLPGYGATLSEINSYIGCVQMEYIDVLLQQQKTNAKFWKTILEDELISPISLLKTSEPNYWVYGILSNEKRSFIQAWRRKGYYASGVHLPNNNYSVFGSQEILKGVNEFYSKFVALPCGWWFKACEIL